jgi:hypothetical protein
MKKYLVSMACVLLAAMTLDGCASSREKAAREAEQAAKVKAALAERHYKIVVNSMADLSETDEKRSPQLKSNFRLEVRNDSLITFLPQYGYNQILSEAGVGWRGLRLYEPISSYQEELTKKGKRHIEISVENDNDTLIFVIEVSAKGNSNISVRSRRRERISFAGQMEFSL